MKKTVVTIFNVVIVMLLALILVSCVDPIVPPETTTYTVTFNADNGTDPVVVTVEEGETVEEPTPPVKAGFIFDAWYLGDTEYDFNQAVNANITLIAHWDEEPVEDVEYTVTFNSVGGTPITAQTVDAGDQASAPTAPSKTHFVFDTWTLNGAPYNFEAPVTSNLTLVAKYTYVGIPNSPNYVGRTFNADFDQMLNNFTSGTLNSTMAQNASVATDQPYISVGYSGTIGNNPDGALWKQAGSENAASPAFQYLVLRLRGFAGASVNDLAIGFRLDDNHDVLVVPFTETLDPNLEGNTRELDGTWFNYVISITDTLDGKTYVGKSGHSDVDAGGLLVGFHLMNTSGVGSGVLELKDAYYSKVPNPVYPYEGSNYSQNRDYWSDTVGVAVGSYVTIRENGFYGNYLETGANPENTHVVLRLKQASPGTLDYDHIKIAPVFANGEAGTPVAFSELDDLPALGSGWLNLTIAFADIYDGEAVVAGYKLINEGLVDIAITQSFLTYLGQYEAVDYPMLDLSNVLIFDNFNRPAIGTTPVWSGDNAVALANGFSYLISYAGLQASTIGDGHITFDSTGGDYVDYVVHSPSKANINEYRYLVFKYKLNDSGTLNNLRMIQTTSGDTQPAGVIYANQWVAGLGLPSIPEDMGAYPYKDGEWTYLIVDLVLTEGFSTDFGGFTLFYTGSSLSIDAIFFANPISNKDLGSEFMWATFEGLALGTAQDKTSDNQWWANVYDSATTIVEDGEDNQALQIDGTGYAQYHTGIKGTGRYLAFDLKILTPGEIVSFRVGPTGAPKWAKDGQLILENGAPMVVNQDGQWHRYVIDWVASGFGLTDTIGFHASDGEIYLLDNLAWYSELPYFDEELVWGTWEWADEGSVAGQPGEGQWWVDNYGTPSTFVDIEGNMWLKLDATSGYVQLHTGVKAVPRYIAFDIMVEAAGSFGINTGGTHKWNAELIGLDGNPIVLPAVGQSGHIVIDVLLSGLLQSDTFGIQANDGAVYFIDNLSFQWNNPTAHMYPVLTEDFEATPVNDGEKYWWGEWALVTDGAIALVTADYATVRFGSPLIAGASYLTFEVKLDADDNGDSFRLELGDGNIVTFADLIADGYASALTENFQTVTINLADYVANLGGLQVLGFHINAGGVIIDNLTVSVNETTHQMRLFNDEPVE